MDAEFKILKIGSLKYDNIKSMSILREELKSFGYDYSISKYHIFENINIFRNIKIWIYSKKLIYKYRSIKKQSKDLYVINNLKEAISIIEPVYIKEIRKEKLKNIKS